jgi:DNA-binding response OmpR family regulator
MELIPDQDLLIVDDELELRELLAEYFGRQGFQVRMAESAADAREQLLQQPTRLAILDVHMSGEDGLSLMKWLRLQHPRTGIVMLTAAADTVDRVVGLELGADDYVSKPFELRELLARVKSVQRRLADTLAASAGAAPGGRRVAFGRCMLDLDERRLLGSDGQDLAISSTEFDLLALFAKAPNRPLTRDQIMLQAHNRAWDAYDRSIDLRIMRLRRKIELNPNKPEILKTVRNVGYVFVAPVMRV